MDLSMNCTQVIENRCTSSALTKFASWTDRKGTKNYFWHGNRNSTDEGCQCSLEGECASLGLFKTLCNCDGFGNNVVDKGEITSMNKLPITKLNYGTSIANGNIKYYLGPMICTGKRGIFPSEQDDADKQLVQEQIKNVTEELRTAKKEIYSTTAKLKSEVQEKIQTVAQDLGNTKKNIQLIRTNLQSRVDQLQVNYNQTLHKLINVTSINQSLSRQKRELEADLNGVADAFKKLQIEYA